MSNPNITKSETVLKMVDGVVCNVTTETVVTSAPVVLDLSFAVIDIHGKIVGLTKFYVDAEKMSKAFTRPTIIRLSDGHQER